jgi:hypothetical protein
MSSRSALYLLIYSWNLADVEVDCIWHLTSLATTETTTTTTSSQLQDERRRAPAIFSLNRRQFKGVFQSLNHGLEMHALDGKKSSRHGGERAGRQ